MTFPPPQGEGKAEQRGAYWAFQFEGIPCSR
ncbi:hypothetical protein ACVWZF_000321 [Thermostichus sp. OS-CIW-30]|jgi:hypothetical protein